MQNHDFPAFSNPPTQAEMERLLGWIENTRLDRHVAAQADKWQLLVLLFTHEMLLAVIIQAQQRGLRPADMLARLKQSPQSLLGAHPFIADVASAVGGLDSAALTQIVTGAIERVEALLGALDQPVDTGNGLR